MFKALVSAAGSESLSAVKKVTNRDVQRHSESRDSSADVTASYPKCFDYCATRS